ncbi:MAG: carboxypeptidase-like regulatory domain-containing protein [Bacteroidales bacterium]|nr:carboxypeptidase-like regulatory domain-containing protein [Bacteroidales bacterium]
MSKILSIFLLIIPLVFFGQTHIEGEIVDSETNQPLPFVNIVYNSTQRLGTTSDLDGKFIINAKSAIQIVEFSFIGYQTQSIRIVASNPHLKIKLIPEALELQSVDVLPGENPAHRIINKAIENRSKNNPESLSSFSYETYSKMFFTFDMFFYKNGDTLTSEELTFGDTLTHADSSIQDINQFKNDQYLFLMESITEKKYKRPGKISEKVVASRVSGLKNPVFALIGTQLQSFTIYKDYISVAGKNYLSPLSINSTRQYLFLMEDTLINETGDTTYTLSYRPRKSKNFDGLEGVLQINTKQFAVENFSTKPVSQEGYEVTIRQKYEWLSDSAWFPTQLDANFTFKNLIQPELQETFLENGKTSSSAYIYGKAKTYIRHIDLNPEVKNKEFSHINVDYKEDANTKDTAFWNKYRITPLTQKEINTYKTIDSLGDELNLDKKMRWLTYLTKGQIPVGPLAIELNQLMNYNIAEGFRLGLGLSTNEKVSKHGTINAYFAYGFGDKQWKYGSKLKFNLRDQYDSYLGFQYKNDIYEIGSFKYLEANSMLSQDNFRDYLIRNIYYHETVEADLELRFLYFLKTRFYAQYSKVDLSQTQYELDANTSENNRFEIPEYGLQIRYAYQETYIRTPMGIQALKTKYPVLFLNLSKSLVYDNYTLDYTRIWGKIDKRFLIRNLGISTISLQAGYVFGDIPYFKLFNGRGSYYPFSIVAYNSFGTMGVSEFINSEFIYFFYRHSFGKLLFKTDWFQPEISIVQNMGWGRIQNPEQHLGLGFKSMEQGFFESGLVVDNIFASNSYGYGIAVYYRYGPYAFSKPFENLGFKLSLKFNLAQ